MELCYQQLFIFSLVHPHPAVFCFSLLTVSLFFHFYPSPSLSPLSSSLFHSLSFLLSQCNVIQDRCWQPQLWHCNLCSALVARQPVWDRARWCTSLAVCLQKKKEKRKKREGRVAELAIRPSAKIQMIPPNISVFRMGCFTSAVQQSILGAWGVLGEYGFVAKTQALTHRTVW